MNNRLERVSADRMVAQLCRESYYQFFCEFWKLVAAETFVSNWHIQRLCDELQIMAERVFRDRPKEYDLITNCPPGSSKSTIFSLLLQPWVWTRMPSARFITGSYTESLALDLARKSRDVVMSEKYKAYFPEVQLREDQNTKSYFATTKGGFRRAVGVGGDVIGMHAHFLIIDDALNPQAALSDLDIQRANNWMRETLSQRKVDKQVSVTALVMQRLHQADPTGDWLERGGRLKHVCLPADVEWPILPEVWKECYEDGLFDVKRFPRSVLDEALRVLGDVGYAGQYGQQPSPRGGSLFRVDRFAFEPQVPLKWKRGPVRYWDKGASQNAGSFTVGVKMALDYNDRYWVLDVVRFRCEPGERERRIMATASLDGKPCRIGIEQEPGGAGKEAVLAAQRTYAKAGFRCYVDCVRGTKEERASGTSRKQDSASQEVRADSFSAQVNTYNVVLVPAPWNNAFVEELRFFPNSRYKDQVDACLIGGTLIHCKNRIKRIEQVQIGDEVLTRFGYKRVLWSGITGNVTNLVSVQFSNGASLTGTAHHPLLTQALEWIPLGMVSHSDQMLALRVLGDQVWDGQRRNISMNESSLRELSTAEDFPMDAIFGGREAQIAFIEQSGAMLTGVYPQTVTFITKTRIPSTTQLRTWSASQKANTDRHTLTTTEHQNTLHTWNGYGLYPQLGMDQLRVGLPTLGSAVLLGRSAGLRRASVLSVVSHFRLCAQECKRGYQGTALKRVVTKSDGRNEKHYTGTCVPNANRSSCQNEKGQSIAQEPAVTVPVYNLEVDEVPEFFANGILVHNSVGAYNMLAKQRLRVGVLA